MVIKKAGKKLVDVFLNMNTFPTGFEPECWLRLQLRGNTWVQIAGIKVASWQYKKIVGEINEKV